MSAGDPQPLRNSLGVFFLHLGFCNAKIVGMLFTSWPRQRPPSCSHFTQQGKHSHDSLHTTVRGLATIYGQPEFFFGYSTSSYSFFISSMPIIYWSRSETFRRMPHPFLKFQSLHFVLSIFSWVDGGVPCQDRPSPTRILLVWHFASVCSCQKLLNPAQLLWRDVGVVRKVTRLFVKLFVYPLLKSFCLLPHSPPVNNAILSYFVGQLLSCLSFRPVCMCVARLYSCSQNSWSFICSSFLRRAICLSLQSQATFFSGGPWLPFSLANCAEPWGLLFPWVDGCCFFRPQTFELFPHGELSGA